MTTQELFSKLWNDYTQHTPEAQAIHDLFTNKGDTVVNDHIAYRTVSLPEVTIDIVAEAFKSAGYIEKENYSFPTKHLTAKHYEHPNEKNAPRVFISQLELDDFSKELKKLFEELIGKLQSETLKPENLVLAGNAWGVPSYKRYKQLRKESEYAAWLYVFGFRANHFTVSVNQLDSFSDLESVNNFLKAYGYLLNSSGGEIKGSEEQLLKQSSTLAAIQPIEFEEGTFDLPTCFYEFAERFEDAEGKLYSGFIAQSADKIFESTDFRM